MVPEICTERVLALAKRIEAARAEVHQAKGAVADAQAKSSGPS